MIVSCRSEVSREMGRFPSVEFTDRQRQLKWILGVLAFILASFHFSSYIHEFGHVFFAYLVGGEGRIINTHLSSVSVSSGFPSYVATMGGVWFESVFWLILYRVFWSKPWRSVPLMFALAAPWYGLIGSFLGFEILSMSNLDNLKVGNLLFYSTSLLWWGAWFWILFRKIIRQSYLRITSSNQNIHLKNAKYKSPLGKSSSDCSG